MCNKTQMPANDINIDVENFYNDVDLILCEKIRCKHINTILELKEHIEPRVFKSLNIFFHPDNDTSCIKIENDLYSIYLMDKLTSEWVIFSDRSNLEVVLHPQWTYADLVGGIALLKYGAKAAIWNMEVMSQRTSDELGHDRLGFKVKEVRLRDPQKMYI